MQAQLGQRQRKGHRRERSWGTWRRMFVVASFLSGVGWLPGARILLNERVLSKRMANKRDEC